MINDNWKWWIYLHCLNSYGQTLGEVQFKKITPVVFFFPVPPEKLKQRVGFFKFVFAH